MPYTPQSMMKKIAGTLFITSSLGLAAYSYSSVDDKSNNSSDKLPHSDVTEDNLIKLSKLKEKSTFVKRHKPKIKKSIDESKNIIKRFMTVKSIPGLSVAVSHRGNLLWSKGFGFANLEQGSKCRDTTVMRIASISKPLTMLLVAKLVEEGKLDLDESIYTYLKDKFPVKSWNGKQVDITLRQLTSHTGGIRNYHEIAPSHPIGMPDENKPEFYIRDHYDNVFESLKIFKDDDLVAEPGSKFVYSNFAWALISAVVQSVLEEGKSFEKFWTVILKQQLGMKSTHLDFNSNLIINRANYYYLLKGSGVLMNSPSVDNSYKWAAGGVLSTAIDVNRFGNVMLYSFLGGKHHPNYGHMKGYLKRETVQQLWTPVDKTCHDCKCAGLGWFVITPETLMRECAFVGDAPFDTVSYHSGAAVGASSILLILPKEEIVIALLCNLQDVSMYDLAIDIVKVFLKQLKPPFHS